jgi:hypothetical protein
MAMDGTYSRTQKGSFSPKKILFKEFEVVTIILFFIKRRY